MANSYYQTPTIPRLYTSYPLWQYANGALDWYRSDGDVLSDEELISLIQLDPSKTIAIPQNGTSSKIQLNYKINPNDDDSNMFENNLWNFNYMMVLGHNLASANSGIMPQIMDRSYNDADPINSANLVNYAPFGIPEYDGWSLMELTDTRPIRNNNDNIFRCTFDVEDIDESPILCGSLLWGKYFDFPINCSLNTQTKFDYGVKQKQTLSGKTVSTANWTKPSNWITEPFGLSEPFTGRGDNFQRRSGRRTWKISFDSIAPDKVMNQNPMLNSFGWKPQDNHATGSGLDGNESLYDINYALDFYTNVVNKTMGGHLPMVLQLNKDVFSPESFAIVRMQKDYTITQKSPNLYSVSLTLVEQI